MTEFTWDSFDWQKHPSEMHLVTDHIVMFDEGQPVRVITDQNGGMVAVEYVRAMLNVFGEEQMDVIRIPAQQIARLEYRLSVKVPA